jgi:CubicO group peptidase (beta-lactamase class C family)
MAQTGLIAKVVVIGISLALLSACANLILMNAEELDAFMESKRLVMQVPGLAAGIMTADGVAWEGYYGTYDGVADVSADTIFGIASISKTVIATAAMQLWEQGLFDLENDINDYLPFSVHNPSYPDTPITFRMLMTHRSSIVDRYPFYMEMYTIGGYGEIGGDTPWALGDFLSEYLSPDGQFSQTGNWLSDEPGSTYEYSNYGAALLAYLVARISGIDYAEYCRQFIFGPLGMEHTYYRLREIPPTETELAVPFAGPVALDHYDYPDYPAGSLRTTIRDLGRFAGMYLNGGTINGVTILQPETIKLMWQSHGRSDDQGERSMGLIWVHMTRYYFGATGHTGGDPGISTSLLLYPRQGFAVILFANGEGTWIGYEAEREIVRRLWREGRATSR